MRGHRHLTVIKGLPLDQAHLAQLTAQADRGLWLFSGRWRQDIPARFDVAKVTRPFGFWDGRDLVSNLPGVGLTRRFADLTIQFYRCRWDQPCPALAPHTLLIPSYQLNVASYYDGPVLGCWPSQDGDVAAARLAFALPHGCYSYSGPLAAGSRPAEASSFRRPSARHLRAAITTALGQWLYHRFAPRLCEVVVDAHGCMRSQAIALIYLKMAEYFPNLAVKISADITPQWAKGFKALSRNLGCYVGKAKPSFPQEHPPEVLSLTQLLFLLRPDRLDEYIADFNDPSDLIPSAFRKG